MLANMASSLIMHKRIHTTLAKAKALRSYIEPLITRSKDDTTHSRRLVFSYLQSKEAVTELFREISVKVADRPGGYTRIIKIGNRLGDNADMCMMELVDFNENLLAEKQAKPKSSRRRRGAGKKKAEDQVATETAVAEETHEVVDETVTEPAVDKTTEEKTVADTEAAEEEKKEEPVAETKEETPQAEVKEEPEQEEKVKDKIEEPVDEIKEEEKKKEVPEAKVEEEKPAEKENKKDSEQESK